MNNFQTPQVICNYMVNLLPAGYKKELILEPTPGQGNLVNTLKKWNYKVASPDGDFWDMKLKNWYNAIVMNPPFTPMKKGYDILYRCMEVTDYIIVLMPWLVIINSEKRTKDITKWGLKAITHLPRWIFKGSRVQTCILEMQKGWYKPTELKILDSNFLKQGKVIRYGDEL